MWSVWYRGRCDKVGEITSAAVVCVGLKISSDDLIISYHPITMNDDVIELMLST